MALYDPNYLMMSQQLLNVFIGPESDHCLPLSVTHSCLVNLIDVTLACEDANLKLVEVATVTDADG